MNINFICFITNIAVTLLCGLLMLIIPTLTRKSYLFGVKVPIEKQSCSEAKGLKKRYTTICMAGFVAILALVFAQYLFFPDITLVSVMYFPFLFVAAQMSAFIPNWKSALKLKKERGWKVSSSVFAETKSSYSRGNLSELPWIWYAGSFIIIFISFILALVKFPSLPNLIPTHFDINMQPDAWSDKSFLSVSAMPLINFATLILMWAVGLMFVKAKLQIDPQNPALSFTQHRIYRRRIGHSLGFITFGLTASMALIGLLSIYPDLNIPFVPLISFTSISIIPTIVVPIISGQSGCKIKPKNFIKNITENSGDSQSNDTVEYNDDKYWALGMFYHNRNDPAYIVEDRFGGNLGFNYARLPVKIGIAALIPAFIAMYVLITVMIFYI